MRGIYDYRGECFGYIENGHLYNLEGKHSGYINNNAVTSLDGTLIWHVDRDGLYDKHWTSIGYLGSEERQDDEY